MINIDSLPELLAALVHPSALVELALLVGCLGLSWAVCAALRPRDEAAGIWFGNRGFDGALFPLLALALALALGAGWGLHKTATRDDKDYQRVMLDTPMLILDEEGERPVRISAQAGVYREDARVLNLEGGVKLNGGDINFTTASSVFNTATGELEGTGEITGAGVLGEIIAKSYGVYDKGDRMVFKGGVHTHLDSN